MNPDIMFYFDFTFSEWIKLGLIPEDIKGMPDAHCVKVFGVGQSELLQIYAEFCIAGD